MLKDGRIYQMKFHKTTVHSECNMLNIIHMYVSFFFFFLSFSLYIRFLSVQIWYNWWGKKRTELIGKHFTASKEDMEHDLQIHYSCHKWLTFKYITYLLQIGKWIGNTITPLVDRASPSTSNTAVPIALFLG